MNEIVQLTWRLYPATLLMLAGLALALRGLWLCHAAWPRPADLMQPLAWLRGFRRAVVGLALLGLGAAWLWQLAWLCALSLIVGSGEILESSLTSTRSCARRRRHAAIRRSDPSVTGPVRQRAIPAAPGRSGFQRAAPLPQSGFPVSRSAPL